MTEVFFALSTAQTERAWKIADYQARQPSLASLEGGTSHVKDNSEGVLGGDVVPPLPGSVSWQGPVRNETKRENPYDIVKRLEVRVRELEKAIHDAVETLSVGYISKVYDVRNALRAILPSSSVSNGPEAQVGGLHERDAGRSGAIPQGVPKSAPQICKWDDSVNGYVPILDPNEAQEAAEKCIYPRPSETKTYRVLNSRELYVAFESISGDACFAADNEAGVQKLIELDKKRSTDPVHGYPYEYAISGPWKRVEKCSSEAKKGNANENVFGQVQGEVEQQQGALRRGQDLSRHGCGEGNSQSSQGNGRNEGHRGRISMHGNLDSGGDRSGLGTGASLEQRTNEAMPDVHDVRAKARELCIRFGLVPEREDTIVDVFEPLLDNAFYAGLNHAETDTRKAVVRMAEEAEQRSNEAKAECSHPEHKIQRIYYEHIQSGGTTTCGRWCSVCGCLWLGGGRPVETGWHAPERPRTDNPLPDDSPFSLEPSRFEMIMRTGYDPATVEECIRVLKDEAFKKLEHLDPRAEAAMRALVPRPETAQPKESK